MIKETCRCRQIKHDFLSAKMYFTSNMRRHSVLKALVERNDCRAKHADGIDTVVIGIVMIDTVVIGIVICFAKER